MFLFSQQLLSDIKSGARRNSILGRSVEMFYTKMIIVILTIDIDIAPYEDQSISELFKHFLNEKFHRFGISKMIWRKHEELMEQTWTNGSSELFHGAIVPPCQHGISKFCDEENHLMWKCSASGLRELSVLTYLMPQLI